MWYILENISCVPEKECIMLVFLDRIFCRWLLDFQPNSLFKTIISLFSINLAALSTDVDTRTPHYFRTTLPVIPFSSCHSYLNLNTILGGFFWPLQGSQLLTHSCILSYYFLSFLIYFLSNMYCNITCFRYASLDILLFLRQLSLPDS